MMPPPHADRDHPTQAFVLRAMSIADYDEVLALWRISEGVGLSDADSRTAIDAYLERNPAMSFVARAADHNLIGAVLCGHDGRRGFLHHLAVRSDLRHFGIGRALVDACLSALQSVGIDKCHLFVYVENRAGRAFWQACGWEERVTLALYSKDLE